MYFIESTNIDGVHLNEDITYHNLIEKFRGYLGLNVLLAFIDKKSVSFIKEAVK